MKLFLKIGCGAMLGLAILLGIAYAIYYKEHGPSRPTQSIKFLNTGSELRSVTFEEILADGKLDDMYTVDRKIKPGESLILQVEAANYKISVWGANDSLVKSSDFKIVLPKPKESNYELMRFDLALDKVFVAVNMNSLYEGNSFAEHMSKAMGTSRDRLGIAKYYDGALPFLLEENLTIRTVIDLDEDFPDRVSYGNTVYGLFAVPKTLRESQLESNLMTQIEAKLK